jgi:hypothetical protein
MKIRRLIKESLKFDGYDIIALPCNLFENPAVLAGLPAVSFSLGGTPVQVIANTKRENDLFSATAKGELL